LTSLRSIPKIIATAVSPRKGIYAQPQLSVWINTQVTRDSLIALPWVGIIGYYTDTRILDTLGLNDEHIAHLKKPQRGIDTEMDPDHVLSKKPDIIFINVDKRVALGEISFEEGGGWKVGDREMIKLLVACGQYYLVTDAPTDIIVFKRKY